MTRLVAAFLFCLLGGCLSLPGSDTGAPTRYTLRGPPKVCIPVERTLALDVVQVVGGLDTDRIAQVQEETGEVTYLQNVRWAMAAGAMLEHRLAADLECRGIAVQTGHRARAGQDQLLCELRALNLREGEGGRVAQIALSCIYRGRQDAAELALVRSAQVPLDRYSATTAIRAFDAAYAEVFDGLFAGISGRRAPAAGNPETLDRQ